MVDTTANAKMGNLKQVPKRAWRFIGWVSALIVAILGTLGISICSIWHPFSFPEQVTILVPVQGEKSDQQAPPYASKISRDTVTTIERARRLYESSNKALKNAVVFQDYPEGKDQRARYEQAIQQIERARAAGRPAVAVIGHTSSQATLDAGPAYAKFGLPILMPYATRTDISRELCALEGQVNESVHHHTPFALALVPPNAQQAATIAGFLRDKLADPKTKPAKVPKVVIFRDAVNDAYSADCANRLEELLEEVPVGQSEPPIEVIADISAGGASGQWYISQELVDSKPDAVVVIGGTKVAVEILRQAKAVELKPRFMLLTDGAVDLNLVSRVKQALSPGNGGKDSPTVYVSFPESAVVPQGYEVIFTEKASENRNIRGLSHAAFLTDAVFLAMLAVRNANDGSKNCLEEIMDRGRKPSDSAAMFLSELQQAMARGDGANGYTVSAGTLLGPNRAYEFSEAGARSEENLQYYIYKLVPDAALDNTKQGYERIDYVLTKK